MAIQEREERVDRLNEAPDSQDSIQFIGNATVLIRYGDLAVLTDPNFVHRGVEVPLGYGLSTVRLTDPAMEIDQLPRLDLVVLSHYHGDHFDTVAEERLDRSIPIATTPQAADTLLEKGFTELRPLETWASTEVRKGDASLRVTAMPAQHAPGVISVAMPEVMGSLLEFWRGEATGDPALRIYVSGDTVMYEGLNEIAQRQPQVDIALLHLGGTRVMGVTVSLDAAQGMELLRLIGPKLAVPIHYNDYEAFKSPLSDFVALVNDAGWEERVSYVLHGDRLVL